MDVLESLGLQPRSIQEAIEHFGFSTLKAASHIETHCIWQEPTLLRTGRMSRFLRGSSFPVLVNSCIRALKYGGLETGTRALGQSPSGEFAWMTLRLPSRRLRPLCHEVSSVLET